MFERLEEVEQRYNELAEKLADPTVWSDQKEYQRLAKAHSDLTEIITKFREYKRVHQQKLETEELLRDHLDEEMKALAYSELDTLKDQEAALEEAVSYTHLTLPTTPYV